MKTFWYLLVVFPLDTSVRRCLQVAVRFHVLDRNPIACRTHVFKCYVVLQLLHFPVTHFQRHFEYLKLENVAINDYCHWRPPDAMPLLTQNAFGGPGHQPHNFDGFIYIHYAAPPYSARISAIYLYPSVWQSLVGFRLLTSVCNAWQRSRTQNLQIVGKNSSFILSRFGVKVHELLGRCRRPLVFSNTCPCHVLFGRYSSLSLEVVKNRTDV